MSSKSLHGLSGTDIPELGEGVAGTGDEDVLVGRVDADRHDIAEVIRELGHLGTRLDIPQHARHISGRGEDAAIIDKAAAREVTRVSGQFARNAGGAFAGGKIVDGTDVVQTTTGDVVSTGSVCARHDPRGPQWDGVNFVCGVGVPDDEFAVLRGGDEMATVGRPVHSVNLGQMTLQRPPGLHSDPRQRVGLVLRDLANCFNEEIPRLADWNEDHGPSESQGARIGSQKGMEWHTGGIGKLILSALDLVLQTFSLAPGGGDLGLHLFAAHIGCHDDGASPWRGRSIGRGGRGREE